MCGPLGVTCLRHLEDSHEDSPHKLCVVLVARATKQATLAQSSTLRLPQQSMILQALKWAVINMKMTATVAALPLPPHTQVIYSCPVCTQLKYTTYTHIAYNPICGMILRRHHDTPFLHCI